MTVSDDIQLKFRLLKADLEEFKEDFKVFASKINGRFDKLYELVDGLAGDFRNLMKNKRLYLAIKAIILIE